MEDTGIIQIIPGRKPAPAVQIITFAHAGGSRMSHAAWDTLFPPDIGVVRTDFALPPGTGPETAGTALKAVADQMATGVARHLRTRRPGGRAFQPFVIYGHSLGAIIAFEVCRRLSGMAMPPPLALVVSGRRDPKRAPRGTPLCALPDEALLDALAQLDPVPGPTDRSHLRQMIPRLREHLHLTDLYRYVPAAPLASPIVALRGADDPIVRPEDMADWACQTTDGFRFQDLPGAHFFDAAGTKQLLAELTRIAVQGRDVQTMRRGNDDDQRKIV